MEILDSLARVGFLVVTGLSTSRSSFGSGSPCCCFSTSSESSSGIANVGIFVVFVVAVDIAEVTARSAERLRAVVLQGENPAGAAKHPGQTKRWSRRPIGRDREGTGVRIDLEGNSAAAGEPGHVLVRHCLRQ